MQKRLFYSNSIEHIFDKCRQLELLLQIAIKKAIKKSTSSNPHGLFISSEDVECLFREISEVRDDAFLSEIEKLKNQFVMISKEIAEAEKKSIENGIFLSLLVLQNTFRLSPFEVDVIILSLMTELNKKYEKIYGFLQDDMTLKKITIDLIPNILSTAEDENAHILRYFLQQNKLFRYDLLKAVDCRDCNGGIASKALKVDERIVNYLFEINEPDHILANFTALKAPHADMNGSRLAPETKERLISALRLCLEGKTDKKLFIHLNGPYGSGKRQIAEALCKEAGIFLLTVDTAEIIKTDAFSDSLIKKIFREGILQPAAVYFENSEQLFIEDEKTNTFKKLFFKIADEFSWITFFSSEYTHSIKEKTLNKHILIHVELRIPDSPLRRQTWQELIEKEGIVLAPDDLSSLANKFKFTEGQITDVISSAKNNALCSNGSGRNITIKSLYEGCRRQSNHKLSTLAQRVKSTYVWNDIVLQEDKLRQLREITNHIRYKDVVYEEWGFNKKMNTGRGLTILFTGPSGTGKTMAASLIANEISLELYKIDLSSVVSKYIGETEKNLSKIFREAETSNAILFFDEADALFGKRTEIKDAHDRYANIEVNYLLQKLEEHEGIVIMASNLSKNIDDAFLRRMQFVVEFPFPDELHRELIWKKIFPKNAPLSKDIDFRFISKTINLPGGNIKNIAISSAFYAAEASSEIAMRHVMHATKREYKKLGKSFLKTDFEPYYDFIDYRSQSMIEDKSEAASMQEK